MKFLAKHAPAIYSLAAIASERAAERLQPAASAPPRGLNLVGYLRGTNGLGVSARAIARALETSDLPHAFIAHPPRKDRGSEDPEVALGTTFPYSVTAIHVNPRPLPAFLRAHARAALRGRKLVGIWFWELEQLPRSWRGLSRVFDEVWAASEWNREHFARQLHCPVYKLPVPLDTLVRFDSPRAALPFALPEAAVVFVHPFNFKSGFDRKNPMAVIDAYVRAFPEATGSTLLVLKSLHSAFAPERFADLRRRVAGRTDVIVYDGELSGAQMDALYDRMDCLVSLHRSEGLGLGILEAWRRGKWVVFTDYSGPREFRDLPRMLTVDCRPTRVVTEFEPYRGRGEWADPSVAHASERLREVASHGRAQLAPSAEPAGYCADALRAFLRERVEALSAFEVRRS